MIFLIACKAAIFVSFKIEINSHKNFIVGITGVVFVVAGKLQVSYYSRPTGGSFTMAVSNSLLSQLGKSHSCRFRYFRVIFFLILKRSLGSSVG